MLGSRFRVSGGLFGWPGLVELNDLRLALRA